jgi:hypothetical protein
MIIPTNCAGDDQQWSSLPRQRLACAIGVTHITRLIGEVPTSIHISSTPTFRSVASICSLLSGTSWTSPRRAGAVGTPALPTVPKSTPPLCSSPRARLKPATDIYSAHESDADDKSGGRSTFGKISDGDQIVRNSPKEKPVVVSKL